MLAVTQNALYRDSTTPLCDDLREAVTTLEETDRIARRACSAARTRSYGRLSLGWDRHSQNDSSLRRSA